MKIGRLRDKLNGYCCEPLVVLADIVIIRESAEIKEKEYQTVISVVSDVEVG